MTGALMIAAGIAIMMSALFPASDKLLFAAEVGGFLTGLGILIVATS